MWVTIYTDASYYRERKISTIAYYIKCDRGLIKDGMKLDFKKVRDNNEAEMIAIKKAIQVCLGRWNGIRGIQVNTDSLVAREVLKYKAKKSQKYQSVQSSVTDMVSKHSCMLKIKHVYSHQFDNNIRAWLNNWCDANAKRMARV